MKLKQELKTLHEETNGGIWNCVYYLCLRIPGSTPLESQTQQQTTSLKISPKIKTKQQTKKNGIDIILNYGSLKNLINNNLCRKKYKEQKSDVRLEQFVEYA